jgi:hypothetical protein
MKGEPMGQHKFNPRAIAKANGKAMPNMQLNIDDLPIFVCPTCHGERFFPTFRMFPVPVLMRAFTRDNDLLQMETWECMGCGKEIGGSAQMKEISAAERKTKTKFPLTT